MATQEKAASIERDILVYIKESTSITLDLPVMKANLDVVVCPEHKALHRLDIFGLRGKRESESLEEQSDEELHLHPRNAVSRTLSRSHAEWDICSCTRISISVRRPS